MKMILDSGIVLEGSVCEIREYISGGSMVHEPPTRQTSKFCDKKHVVRGRGRICFSYELAEKRLVEYKGPFINEHYVCNRNFASIVDGRLHNGSNGTVSKWMLILEKNNVRFLRNGRKKVGIDFDDGFKALDALARAGYLKKGSK